MSSRAHTTRQPESIANPSTSTRERQRLETRERIFRVAIKEIARGGLAGVSVASLARKADVTRQTIYDHFPTLDLVIEEALSRYRATVASKLHAINADVTFEEVLHHTVDALFESFEGQQAGIQQEINAHLARGVNVTHWLNEPLFKIISTAIERAKASGAITSPEAADDLARLTLTSISGFLNISSEPISQRKSRAHLAVTLIATGLKCRKDSQ